MGLGRLLYKVRATFQDGLKVAYYRDVVRPKILRTEPIQTDERSACEVHVLTSADDWLNLLWALKSFYCFSRRRYALCIHDDGTLGAEAAAELHRHFPAARVIWGAEADREVLATLEPYPNCAGLRRTNKLSRKIFDFRHYLRGDRFLLLDSDVLFFSEPVELLRRADDPAYRFNSANEDVESAYTIDSETARDKLLIQMVPRFNSGLGVIHVESLKLEWLEEFLSLSGVVGHFWRIEQTLFALCSSRYGVDLLPDEYRVRLDGKANGTPSRHYVGAVRTMMYEEGLSRLHEAGFLRSATVGHDSER